MRSQTRTFLSHSRIINDLAQVTWVLNNLLALVVSNDVWYGFISLSGDKMTKASGCILIQNQDLYPNR